MTTPAHKAGDGTLVPANPACTQHYSYIHGTNYPDNGGHWADPAGTVQSNVRYSPTRHHRTRR